MKPIVLELTPDEAIVLFEIVRRFSDTDILTSNDPAEQRVLWNLCCLLEKQNLVDSKAATYEEAINDAKARLAHGLI